MICLDDADLALIEANHPSALVQRLIWKIRELQDENLGLAVELENRRTSNE